MRVRLKGGQRGMASILTSVGKDSERALNILGLRIIDDAVNEEPKVPVDTGLLRSSGVVDVKGSRMKVAFNTPYAAKQHEINPKGKKYLSSKIEKYRETRYKELLEREL